MSQYLGQHFLKNISVIKKIIDALDLKSGDILIEIGPGKGALTIPLGERCREVGCSVIAIEKDAFFAQQLQEKLVTSKLEIKTGDALQELPSLVSQFTSLLVHYKIVGNIPYYITGALLRVISELPHRPVTTVLMVQKEVAERVAASPPKMNLLAAATQIWADVSIISRLKPNDFDPPPEVSSAVIKLETRNEALETGELQHYYDFIHLVFQQPRKTLLNNLSATRIDTTAHANDANKKQKILTTLQSLGYNEKTRAQSLTIQELLELAQCFLSC